MPSRRDHSHTEPPDGGFGWLIVVATGLTQTVNIGFGKTKSLFFQQLLTRFGQSAAATAWCISMGDTFKFILGPLIGALCDKFGHRKIAVCGAILTSLGYILTGYSPTLYWAYFGFSLRGLGFSLFIIPRISVQNLYFSKNRGKANSLSSTLANVGALYMAPLSSYLYDEYGYGGTLLITGAMALHNLPSALLLSPLKVKKTEDRDISVEHSEKPRAAHNSESNGSNSVTNGTDEEKIVVEKEPLELLENGKDSQQYTGDISEKIPEDRTSSKKVCGVLRRVAEWTGLLVLKDKRMILLVCFLMCLTYDTSTSLTVIAGLCLQKGFTMSQVTLMLTICSGLEVGIRVLAGFVYDHKSVRTRRSIVMGGIGVLAGGVTICVPLPNTVPLVMTIWIIHRLCSGMIISQWATAMADIVPRSMITSGVGTTRLFQGVGVLLGPLVAGCIKDYTGSYSYAFYISGAQVMTASATLIVMTKRIRKKEKADRKMFETKEIAVKS